jgi:DNA polymerase (family 10)
MAKGLDARRLREHWSRIDELAGDVTGLTILKGLELDILEDGSLYPPDDLLAEASVGGPPNPDSFARIR